MRTSRLFRNAEQFLFATTLVLVLLGCGAPGSKEITIVYPSSSGLEVGDELRMSGYPIGTISELALLPDGQVGARIRVQSKYVSHITEGVTFTVKRDGLLSPDRFIEMTPGDGNTGTTETRFIGEPTWEDRLRSMTDDLLDSTGDANFREHLDRLAAAAEKAAEAGREEWEARRPELESEAERLLEQLGQEGNEAAEKLRKEIETYLEDLMKDDSEPDPGEDIQI